MYSYLMETIDRECVCSLAASGRGALQASVLKKEHTNESTLGNTFGPLRTFDKRQKTCGNEEMED